MREVRSHEAFKGMLAQHRDDTGLPVLVDFYSTSCAPPACNPICPMLQPCASEAAGLCAPGAARAA